MLHPVVSYTHAGYSNWLQTDRYPNFLTGLSSTQSRNEIEILILASIQIVQHLPSFPYTCSSCETKESLPVRCSYFIFGFLVSFCVRYYSRRVTLVSVYSALDVSGGFSQSFFSCCISAESESLLKYAIAWKLQPQWFSIIARTLIFTSAPRALFESSITPALWLELELINFWFHCVRWSVFLHIKLWTN